MLARLGFVASVLTEGLSTSRTCRLRNATPDRLRSLTLENLDALEQVAEFLGRRRILLYRVSSNVVPYASHTVNTTEWWEEFAPRLHRIGRRLQELGIRISTHPGQYTVLNSPNPAIVRAATAELVYQARLLDALGADTTGKIVVHIGGLYGGGEAEALDRFVANAALLPPLVRRRLVVENDDRLFDADEVLAASRRLNIPVVFDWLHHHSNPTRRPIAEVLAEIFTTWRPADGRPKVHLSSQARGALPGAHADFVAPRDFLAFLEVAPPQPFDCMLEAKQKDRALLRLRASLRARGIVERDLEEVPAGDPAPGRSRERALRSRPPRRR
jgi:UV DNA damage endonuclease